MAVDSTVGPVFPLRSKLGRASHLIRYLQKANLAEMRAYNGMADLLLEIGTEEIPAGYMRASLAQLRDALTERLDAARIGHSEICVVGTPRRMVAQVRDVSDMQRDEERSVRGPSVTAAYGADGSPTKALEGFMRGQGVTVADLERVGDYVMARKIDRGRPSSEALAAVLPEMIRGFAFPKFMRWGEARMRFVRPIRWILCQLGTDTISFELEGICSGPRTRGHRFLSPAEFEVRGADDYFAKLPGASIMVDPVDRERVIREGAVRVSRDVGEVSLEDDLVEENVFLVETPAAILGKFDDTYLELPEPVLVMAMKKHEKFFPVRGADGKLTPYFVAIRNGHEEDADAVREGNQRVLSSRFNDAKFFFDEDTKRDLPWFAERLDRLVFQEKLGTIKQKVERIASVLAKLTAHAGWATELQHLAAEASRLAKADLASGMVVELPALQGVIGAEYARRAGYPDTIVEAIEQHYLPKGAGDSLPNNPIARAISLVDRMDTLVGYFGIGISPTGSSDPFALRRAAQGAVEIQAEESAFPDLSLTAEWAYAEYVSQDAPLASLATIQESLNTLIEARLMTLLEQDGIRYDLARATMGGGWTCSASRLRKRARAIQSLSERADWGDFVTAAIRPANIVNAARKNKAEFGENIADVRLDLFASPRENELHAATISALREVARHEQSANFDEVYEALRSLAAPINAFFDAVMVMDENPDLRANRLTLMAGVNHLFHSLADLSQVIVEGE